MSMQHFVHLFIGREMKEFRDLFASTFKKLNPDIQAAFFTPLVVEASEDSLIGLEAPEGDEADTMKIDNDDVITSLTNFFDDLYTRKVTVASPGNRSMVVAIWCKMYETELEGSTVSLTKALSILLDALKKCRSNISIELNGFTNDAVSCFIPEPSKRLAPAVYYDKFKKNEEYLREKRTELQAIRLISNYNIDDVALNLKVGEIARVCAEFAALQSRHYLEIYRPLASAAPTFESFGLSSIIFDLQYYHDYISNRIIIDKISEENVNSRRFNLNSLAQRSNPELQLIITEIKGFYDKYGTDAKAKLALGNNISDSNAVAEVDKELNRILDDLRNRIDQLLKRGDITLFEREALMSMILGDDNEMFEVSNVGADEIIIDDIIDEAVQYYSSLDPERVTLQNVTQRQIKSIRTQMRNIAAVNREREKQLETLDRNKKEARQIHSHFDGQGYRFGDTDYKVDLQVDSVPLADTYTPGVVNVNSIDLRDRFLPVRDQGEQGCCSAFAVAAIIEALRNDRHFYSPAFLYWNARALDGNTSFDSGSSINQVINGGNEKGVCLENTMPYNPAVFKVAPTEEALKEGLECRILKALNVNLKLEDIKAALVEGYPVIVATRIFDSFANTIGGFVPRPSAEEQAAGRQMDGHGNHAMVICGFSDKERVFVVRNSWGRDFGDDGYCYISYAYAKKFFLQAAIITEVTPAEENHPVKYDADRTLNFNETDSNIQAAILQNLIDEDKEELEELASKSTNLRIKWTQNVGKLGNVNTQNQLVKGESNRLESQMHDEQSTIDNLSAELPGKVKARRYYWWKLLFWFTLASILTTWSLFHLIDYTWMWVTEGLVVIPTLILWGVYRYRIKLYRQSLLDEIKRHSDHKDLLNARKVSLGIQGHIRGKIIREVGDLRLELQNNLQKLKAFNREMVNLYENKETELERMNPSVPYPFLEVLCNQQLDKFYEENKDAFVSSINLRDLIGRFTPESDLFSLFASNDPFTRSIAKGIERFTMRDYLIEREHNRWSFLPAAVSLGNVINDLEQHALPFCRYNEQIDNHDREKYLFAQGITQSEVQELNRFFTSNPVPISISDKYRISILNIVRYN